MDHGWQLRNSIMPQLLHTGSNTVGAVKHASTPIVRHVNRTPRQAYATPIVRHVKRTPRQSYATSIVRHVNRTPRQSYATPIVRHVNRTPHQAYISLKVDVMSCSICDVTLKCIGRWGAALVPTNFGRRVLVSSTLNNRPWQ